MENYTTGTGQRLLVHEKKDCKGEYCVIHNPSVHSMSTFPTHWRGGRSPMERICPHGIGHPDPDDLAYTTIVLGEEKAHWYSIHGCDGCCRAR